MPTSPRHAGGPTPPNNLNRYAISRRRKAGTFTRSKTTAKVIAAMSVPTTTKGGKGVIAIPPTASRKMIDRPRTTGKNRDHV
jgi:hypothetical protein